jgi:hypothetical protein
MLPILNLVLSVFASCATLYLVDDAYQAYLETAPLREFVLKAFCAAGALVLSVALWLALYLA